MFFHILNQNFIISTTQNLFSSKQHPLTKDQLKQIAIFQKSKFKLCKLYIYNKN
jgi:hypothetical protein